MARIAVIGAGIAGLSAAHVLHKEGIEVVVFEARSSVGGMIRTVRSEGFLVEEGPNSIQTEGQTLARLIREIGLESRRVHASDAAKNRYIVRGGEPVAVPASPMAFLTSPLFGAKTKLRLMREPFVAPVVSSESESVAAFVRRRLGSEVLDYGVEPFVAGIFAGDPEKLSLQHAFPRLHEMEQTHGSIVRGQLTRRSGTKAPSETHRMFSFDDGLVTLPLAIANALGSRIRLDAAVDRIERDGKRWRLGNQDAERFDAVVFTAPLPTLETLTTLSGPDFLPLPRAVYAPVRVVALGYRREQVRHPLDGFGLLVPRVEAPFQILGTLFTSSIFPDRAPAGHVLLTTFVGGMRRPDLTRCTTSDLVNRVQDDLHALLGLAGSPVFVHHKAWPYAIPQYGLGYQAVLDAVDTLETAWPGWFMAGNYRGGISVGDAASSGERAARACLDYARRSDL